MNAYFDTSSWVKKYIQEEGTSKLVGILKKCRIIAISRIAYAEVYAAFSRRLREGTVTRKEFGRLARGFEKDWRALTVVELSEEVASRIPALVLKLPLRGFDAIHLSSALWLRSRLPAVDTFVASDAELLRSARESGFRCLDPESA
jgi:predicted nucleic acid-binding protein